jgi:hypothetical protein
VKQQYVLLEGQDIRLTVLGEKGCSGVGRLARVDASTATIRASFPAPSGGALRLDADDALLLGECSGCVANGAEYEWQVRLQQIIPSVSDLAKLVNAICGATPRAAIGVNDPVRDQVAVPNTRI